MRLLLFIGTMFFSFSLQASQLKVSLLKGEVMAKITGLATPRLLQVNQRLSDSGVIQTGDRSFVQMMIEEDYQLSLGSNSIMSVVLSNDRSSVYLLKKGKIRVKTLNKKSQRRIFILTDNSISEVSRSDGIILHNSSNGNSMCLSLDGTIGFSHFNSPGETTGEIEIDRDKGGELTLTRSKARNSGFLAGLMDKIKGSFGVKVGIGQFSTALNGLSHATIPVVFNPFQANLLANNEKLNDKSRESFLIAESTKYNGKTRLEIAPQTAPPEGFYYASKDQYAPRSGGLIDLNGVFYLAPRENQSEFLREYQIFHDEKLGRLEKELGDYIPPEGMVLDASKGFLVIKEQEKLKQKIEDVKTLNDSILKDVVLLKKISERKALADRSSFTQKDLLNRYTLDFSIGHQMTDLDTSGSGFNRTFEGNGQEFKLGLAHATIYKWQILTGLQYRRIELDEKSQASVSQSGKSTLGVEVGVRRVWNRRFGGSLTLRNYQKYTLEQKTVSNVTSERTTKVTATQIHLMGEYSLLRSGRNLVDIYLGPQFHFKKETSDLTTNSALGYRWGLIYSYQWNPKYALRFGFDHDYIKKETGNQTIKNVDHGNDLKTFAFGLRRFF